MIVSTDFSEAWERAGTIDGWLTMRDAEMLFHAARQSAGMSLEIGAYRGRSTVLLAMAAGRVTTVDPMVVGDYPEEGMTIASDDVTALRGNINDYSIEWVRLESTQYQPHRPVGLLYIDGKHSGGQPLADFRHFETSLLRGCFVCFHDYTTRPEVRAAVDTLHGEELLWEQETGDSIYIGRYSG